LADKQEARILFSLFDHGPPRPRHLLIRKTMDHGNPTMTQNTSSTQIVFARLDPILRTLLTLVTQFRERIDGTIISDDETAASSLTNEEHLLGLVKAQIKLLQQLEEALEELSPNDISNHGGNTRTTGVAQSFIVLVKYVSLPLNAILHITSKALLTTIPISKSSSSIKSTIRQNGQLQIRASAMRQLQERTAHVIQIYVQKCSPPQQQKQQQQSPNEHETDVALLSASLPNVHVVQFLTSLATVLPSGQEQKIKKDDDDYFSSLDSGTDCCIAALQSITAICQICNSNNSNLEQAISQALDGMLVARLADACSSIVTNSQELKKSSQLCFEAVTTLDRLLEIIPIAGKWQQIFPGVFAGLYRILLQTRRYASSGPIVEVECASLKALKRLLQVTLQQSQNGRVVDDKREEDKTSSVIRQLQSMAITTTKSENFPNNSTDDRSKKEEEEESQFLEQVNARVVAPLTVLINMTVISLSPLIRIEAGSLCRVLLLETRGCWEESKVRDLALEICLILENDSDGKSIFSATFFQRSLCCQFHVHVCQASPNLNCVRRESRFFHKGNTS
jgi:hypothetical protein